jgi:hypothetical protein
MLMLSCVSGCAQMIMDCAPMNRLMDSFDNSFGNNAESEKKIKKKRKHKRNKGIKHKIKFLQKKEMTRTAMTISSNGMVSPPMFAGCR